MKSCIVIAWRDPVFSGLISSSITGFISLVIHFFKSSNGIQGFFAGLGFLDILLFFSLSGNVGITVYALKKFRASKDRICLSSQEWFFLIEEKLKDCTSARIYLRQFDHPDNFRKEHKEALMKIIKAIKARAESGADIKLISYNENGEKTGLDWLRNNSTGTFLVDDAVKVVPTQIATNSSSMYLFDDKFVVFNQRVGSSTRYYSESYSGSIMFDFLKKGFDDYWREL